MITQITLKIMDFVLMVEYLKLWTIFWYIFIYDYTYTELIFLEIFKLTQARFSFLFFFLIYNYTKT